MQFALVNIERTRPLPGLIGFCPVCGGTMMAKCGTQRVHHWAHKVERNCDSWWEPETPWHRTWKSKFPDGWQEVIRFDPLGEKHIADVQTPHGLTIEFQHSHLRPEERAAREQFYGNMLWVVDGSRLTRDLPRFANHSYFRPMGKGLFVTPFPDEAFPRSWLACTVPVFFDFQNATDVAQEMMHLTRPIWCLLPGRVGGRAVVLQISRESFVRLMHGTAQPIPTQAILKSMEHSLLLEHQKQVRESLHAAAMAERRRQRWRRQGFRVNQRRF